MYAVLDPDPDIRGGGGGEAQCLKKFSLVWSKNRGGGGAAIPAPPPLVCMSLI